MITSLSINNFALIEKLTIDFSQGFSIITGETGAGKSIILGALGLIMGKRSDLSSLKNKEEKCIIEAQFDISNYNLDSFFQSNDLDFESQTIIRREILPSGKSRAFINDTPVNLQELQELSLNLIDIHSQQQTQELSEDQFQFKIIDAIAINRELIADYSLILKSYKQHKNTLKDLQMQLQTALKEQDYNIFLLEELLSAQLKSGEQPELEVIFEQLNNVEFIKEYLQKSIAVANDEQFGISQNLREMKIALQKIATFSTEYATLTERVESISIELEDIVSELEDVSAKLTQDPEQLEAVNHKLQSIYNLQKKHQVSSVEELIVIRDNLDSEALSMTTLESDIEKLQILIMEAEVKLNEKAIEIHDNRLSAIPILSEKWLAILAQLGMPNVRFNIEVKPVSSYLPNGKDELQFLFSANKGSDFGLLKKVASGGEMSRIMLATKAILANYSKLPTIIFDEIDTGVSGEIADKMGDIMKSMSMEMQVFSITHLPQIAAKGNDHFKVFKTVSDDKTSTELKLLSKDERVVEIAQMLSGAAISDSAINHAKALLN